MGSKIVMAVITVLLLGAGGYYFVRQPSAPSAVDLRSRETLLSDLESQMQELTREIKAAQGRSDCDTDEQCQTLGLGTRVCGEYKNFLIYSTKDANTIRLFPLVSKFNAAHEKMLNLSMSVGDCGVKPAGVHCVGGRCVLRAEGKH